MAYVPPTEVRSPKAHWQLIDVLWDQGEGECAYALGDWDGEHCIGFRWNGTAKSPLGNPQSRGLATWAILDRRLYDAVIELLPPEKKTLARRFLGAGLHFDGITLNDDRRSVVMWDLRRHPPTVAVITCSEIREFVGKPTISEDDCRLLIDRNSEVMTELAEELLAANKEKLNEHGFRVIEIRLPDLRTVERRFTTSVLEIAAKWRWAKV